MNEVAARARETCNASPGDAAEPAGATRDANFRSLVETSLQGIIVHRDWRIVYANPAAARTLGYDSADELAAIDNVLQLVPEEEHTTIKGYYDARLEGRPAPERYQTRLLRRDGSAIHVEMLASVVSWEGTRAVQAAFVDISKRMHALQLLRESEERYALAMKGADEGMWDWHVDTDTVYVSPNVWRYMGMSPTEETSSSEFWFERIHPEEKELFRARLSAHLRGETDFLQCELRMRQQDATYRWFNIHSLALRHDDGHAYRVAGSLHDITQRKLDEKVLEDRMRFDALLTRVSAELIALPSPEIDAAIERTLGVIGRSLDADRGWYLQANRNEPGLLYTHEWCAEGIRPERHDDGMAHFSAEDYPWTWHQLVTGCPVVICSPDDYPPEAKAEREFAIAHKVQSLISVFLDVDGTTVGVLGFETVNHRRTWSGTVVNQLKLLDQVITNAVVRKRADTALRESKELLQTFLDNTPAVMTLKSLENRYLLANRGFEEILGRSKAEILHSTPSEMLAAEHARAVCAQDNMVLSTNEAITVDQEIVHSDGARRSFRDTRFPVYGTDAKLIGIGCYSVDITKLRQVEEALSERESLINAVSENFPGALYRRILHPNGRLEYPFIGESLYRVLGIEKQEVTVDANRWIEAIHPEDRGRWMKALEESAASLDLMSVDIRVRDSHGRTRWMRSVSRPQKLHDGSVVWDGLTLDVTEEVRAIEALRESEERLRRLASEISLAEEKERRRIASELHDGAIQDLALAKIKLGELEKKTEENIDRAGFEEVRKLLEGSIHHARNLIFELSPPVLYELGLAAAVEWMGEQFQSHYGIDCRVTADQGDTGLRPDIEVVLFQVLRELLVNVVKHANASKVDIVLQRAEDHLQLEVNDDGDGFDEAIVGSCSENRGFGLFNIRERLSLLGAGFELDASAGTRVTISAPLTAETERQSI